MPSRWPDLVREESEVQWASVLVSVALAALSGLTGWVLFFVGWGLWGLAVGAAIMLLLSAIHGRFVSTYRSSEVVTVGVACCALTWPLAWIPAAVIFYWMTGQNVGFQ